MVVRYATECGFEIVGIVAAPLHQLRSYFHTLTAVHRAGEAGNQIRIFNLPGWPLGWLERAPHSQGIEKDFRFELLRTEIKKVLKYWKQGDIIATSLALQYFLDHRVE